VFVGREPERRELRRLLSDPTCRLVTLIGPGGIGKTRLAIEAARAAEQAFAHGVCFVPLAGVSPASPLVPTIAEHLGLTLAGRDNPDQRVLGYLREKSLLLVIDNCEHFLAQSAALAHILAHAPGVKVLATSLERLNLHGEVLLPLEGLSFPSATSGGEAEAFDSVRLFVQSARRVLPGFALDEENQPVVARICRFVQGVPLAIELAAAWVGVLSCEEIRQEIERNHDFLFGSLRDVPERHRSLRAVFEASWGLLNEAERRAFRRLSVFRGGFSREAAEEVAGASLPLLSSLVEKSLVQRRSSGRFAVLETLRQYAGERLAEDPLEAAVLAERHAEHFAAFLAARQKRVIGAADPEAVAEVSAEIDNVREAWSWLVRERRTRDISLALDGLYGIYHARGWAREAESVFRAAAELLAPQAAESPELAAGLLARIRARQGVFSAQLGDYDRARQLLEPSLALARRTSQREEEALILDQLGMIETFGGDYRRAKEHYLESLSIYLEKEHHQGTARSYLYLGTIAYTLGEYQEARRLFRECLAVCRRIGDRSGIAAALKNLGGVAFEEEAYAEANALLLESLAIDRELANPMAIANSLQNLGCVSFRAGDHPRAEQYLQEGVSISRDLGFRRMEAFCLNELGNVHLAQRRLPKAAEHFRQALRIATEINQTPMVLEILLGFAQIARESGETGRAAELMSLLLDHPASTRRTQERAELLARSLPGLLSTPRERRHSSADLDRSVSDLLENIPSAAM
jgi:predicted ATPase/Tfp pilus assembly protein PilF